MIAHRHVLRLTHVLVCLAANATPLPCRQDPPQPKGTVFWATCLLLKARLDLRLRAFKELLEHTSQGTRRGQDTCCLKQMSCPCAREVPRSDFCRKCREHSLIPFVLPAFCGLLLELLLHVLGRVACRRITYEDFVNMMPKLQACVSEG